MKDTAQELVHHVKKATQQQENILLFEQRETLFERTPYAFERDVLQRIRQGEPEKLSAILEEYGKTGYIVAGLPDSLVFALLGNIRHCAVHIHCAHRVPFRCRLIDR